MIKQFYLTEPWQVLPLLIRMYQGVMTMNGYSILLKVPELELHRQGTFKNFFS